jgi:hypothetical protein
MIADASRTARWDDATRDVAGLLADRTCIVVVGDHADDTAHVAIALARHAGTRRVAIVDAIGDLRPLQKLLPEGGTSHGVIDHFLHGVSLRKIAHPVNRERTLFVVPSGAGPFEYDSLLRRERWRRLTMAFRAEGALLCILLPPDANGLPAFVEDTDGIVLVGDVEYAEPRHVIANVRRPWRESGDVGAPSLDSLRNAAPARSAREAPWNRTALIAASVVLVLAAGALFAWNRGAGARDDGATRERQAAGVIAPTDSDSAGAAFYSVDLVMLNSRADAGRHLSDRVGVLPAVTFSPVVLGADSARWYRVVVGAWSDRREADSALMALRATGVVQVGAGSVLRTPFAVRVGASTSTEAAMARAAELRSQGFPTYVLTRDGDHANVYAGAFENPSQGTALLDMFKSAGIDATISYRSGRGI